jgi:hypothetical protein
MRPSISAAPYNAVVEALLAGANVGVANVGTWLRNMKEVLNITQIAEGFEPMLALPKDNGRVNTTIMFWRSMTEGEVDHQTVSLQSNALTIMTRFNGSEMCWMPVIS